MYISTLSLTSALDGVGWSTPRPGHFTIGNETWYSCMRGLVSPRAGLDGCGKSHLYRDSISGPSSPYQIALVFWGAVRKSAWTILREASKHCEVAVDSAWFEIYTWYKKRQFRWLRSKALVCGRSLAGTVGSKPAGGMDAPLSLVIIVYC
jgi:hypothetical protein